MLSLISVHLFVCPLPLLKISQGFQKLIYEDFSSIVGTNTVCICFDNWWEIFMKQPVNIFNADKLTPETFVHKALHWAPRVIPEHIWITLLNISLIFPPSVYLLVLDLKPVNFWTYRISSIRRLGVNQQIVCCVPGVKTSRGVILKEASELNWGAWRAENINIYFKVQLVQHSHV